MPVPEPQEWVVRTKLRGNFRIIETEDGRLSDSFFPGLKKLSIDLENQGSDAGSAADRLMALNNALDLVANKAALGAIPTRRCAACGHETKLSPGRANVQAFLEHHGIAKDSAIAIYQARNELAHGASHLSLVDEQTYARYCSILLPILRKEISEKLGLPIAPLSHSPFDSTSVYLAVEFTR